MADTPSLNPAELIATSGADLTRRLAEIARQAVADALSAGDHPSVESVLAALQSVAETLPAALAAGIAAALPEIAATAIERAEVEIAAAREASGSGYPKVTQPEIGDYSGWSATVTAGLIASLIAVAKDAPTADAARAAVVEAMDSDASRHIAPMAETASGRAVNDARLETFRANADIVPKLRYVAVRDIKTSEMCQHLADVEFSVRARDIPRPPLHPGCRSHLAAVMGIKRKKGATEKERDRQDWAVFRRLERAAKAAQAEGRADVEALELRFAPDLDSDAGTFSGYAVAWDVTDNHKTAFARGSLNLPAAGLPLLWAHDPTRPVGTILEARDDGRGLFVRGRLSLGTAAGQEAHTLLKDRAITGLSIGFKRLRDEAMPGGRRILAADLKEVSLVTLPSNESARILEVRGATTAPDADHHHSLGDTCMTTKATTTASDETAATETTATETRSDNSAETRSALDAVNRRLDRIEARSSRTGLAAGNDNADAETETRAFSHFIRQGRESMGAEEIRSLRVADDASGGYTAPSEFRAELLKKIVEVSPVRTIATVTTTGAGELILPKQTGTPTASWVGETEARSGTEPAFGQVSIPAHEAAVYVDVSVKLLEDSAINIESELSSMLAEEYGRLEGVAFVKGDGVKKPRGIISHPDFTTMANGSTSALDADKIIALVYSLPAAYRRNGAFLMSGITIAAVRSLKSATSGEYLFKESLADGVAGTLLGYPITEIPDLDSVASGKVPLLFGDWKAAYRVTDRVGLSLLRDPFTQATFGLVRIHSRRRVGGDLVRPEAVKGLKMSNS